MQNRPRVLDTDVHRDGDGGTHLSPSATATSVLEAAAICYLQRVMLAGRATFISSLFPEQSCRSKAAVAGLTAVPLLWFWVLIGFAVFFFFAVFLGSPSHAAGVQLLGYKYGNGARCLSSPFCSSDEYFPNRKKNPATLLALQAALSVSSPKLWSCFCTLLGSRGEQRVST